MGEPNSPAILDKMETILRMEESALDFSNKEVESIYSFIGPLTESQIQDIAVSVESKLYERGLKKNTVKRTFTILIEGLQNAFIHGHENEYGKYLGLSVFRKGETIDITILAVTDEAHYQKVTGLVNELNSLSPEAIKKHYLQVMTNGKISAKGGAGLGLITMVMKSENGIDLSHHELADNKVIISSKLLV